MKKRNRINEAIVYLVIWTIIIVMYVLDNMRRHAQMSEPLLDMPVIVKALTTLLPYVFLFLINNYVLIPRLLLKNRISKYFFTAAILLGILFIYQYIGFTVADHPHPRPQLPGNGHPCFPPPPARALIPLPLLLDLTYAVLLVGCNIAIALVFQRYDDKLEKETLMKTNAENALSYLKAQISPHFYMNMLNNIHGMIEINPDKAQTMVLDMSRLMRYMLYESSKPFISLSDEIDFLSNYIGLMRLRYDSDKVVIDTDFLHAPLAAGIKLPPLLFLVFIENAFKHGVSYHGRSHIRIRLQIADGSVCFFCANSLNAGSGKEMGTPGIGLRNIRQRLALLYGDRARLEAGPRGEDYVVTLTIPYDEN